MGLRVEWNDSSMGLRPGWNSSGSLRVGSSGSMGLRTLLRHGTSDCSRCLLRHCCERVMSRKNTISGGGASSSHSLRIRLLCDVLLSLL